MTKEREKSFQEFLKYAGKELRRAGDELKKEAQELLENQEKLKKSLRVVSEWAKATAKEVADMAQKHTQEAESKWEKASQKGFCGFGKKGTPGQTFGEPVEKIRAEPPPKAPKAPAPKTTSKTKKASAPKAANKTKTPPKPRKQTAAKNTTGKPAAKKTTKSRPSSN
jgi:hypothetical protein